MNVTREVHKLRWILRCRAAANGFFALVGLLCSALILALVLDPWLGESDSVRVLLVLAFWLSALFLFVRLFLIPILRVPGPDEILSKIEEADPYFQNRVSTAYYLTHNPAEVKRLGFSPALVRRTIGWTERLQPESVFHPFYFSGNLLRTVQLAFVPCLLVLLILLARPRAAMEMWTHYVRSPEPVNIMLPHVEIMGQGLVRRGYPADIGILVSGTSQSPHLHLEERPGQWVGIPAEVLARGLYKARIPPVERTVRYRASVAGIFSKPATITPLDPPELRSVHWHIAAPEYTGLAEVDVMARPGEIELLAGSVVSATFYASLPLSSMTLLESDGTRRELVPAADSIAGSTILFPTGTRDVRVHMVGPLQLEATSEPIRLNVIEDEAPRAKILAAETTQNIPPSQFVTIIAEARDDYGLSSLELYYELNYEGKEARVSIFNGSSGGEPPEGFNFKAVAEPADASPVAVAAVVEWDLAPLELLPGDEISYWLVAFDNDVVNGPKPGRSEVHFLRFPSMYEIYESVVKAEEAQVDSLEDVIERQRQLRENIEDAAEKLREDSFSPQGREEKPRWEEQARLEEAAGEQEEIAGELERISREVRETAAALKQKAETSLRTLEKMDRVRELFDELLTEEMKDIIREFQQAVEQFRQQRGPEPLDELNFSLEQFEQELDSLLELLENTYLERQLEAAVQEMEELLKIQEELLARTEEAAADEERTAEESQGLAERLATQEEEVQERIEELARQLKQLADRMAERGKEGAQEIREVAQEMKEGSLPEDLEQAIEQLTQQQFSQAQSPEQKALDSMAGMSQKMSQLQSMLGGMSFQQDIAALLAMIHRSQYLSERQEEVQAGLDTISAGGSWGNPARKRDLSQEEGLLAIESRRLKEAFIEFAGESPFRDFSVAGLFEDAAREMSAAAAGTKDQSPPGVRARSRAALGHVNLATKKLLDSFCAACQAQQSLGLDGYFQQLRQLIERQKKLNFDTQRLDGTSRQRPSWQQELERIAREQDAIRRELEQLEKLREELQNKEELLGDLNKIGDGMGEIEKDLEDQITDERVQQKQDQVLTRMLDAEKSQREQDLTRERESEMAQGQEMPSPAPRDHDAELRRKLSQPEERLTDENILPRYRNRIRSYFRRLSAEVF